MKLQSRSLAEGLAMGDVRMALPPACQQVQEGEAQWDQGSFHGVGLNVLQCREHWQKLCPGNSSTFAPCHLTTNGSR